MIFKLCFRCSEIILDKDLHEVIIRDRKYYCHTLCYWKIKYGYNTCTK